MCAKLSKNHRGQRSPQGNQKQIQRNEAYSIQQEFGLYHDFLNVPGETVNLMTPAEMIYYLGITFGGVEMDCFPETSIRALVLKNKLTYQYTFQYRTIMAFNGGSLLKKYLNCMGEPGNETQLCINEDEPGTQ